MTLKRHGLVGLCLAAGVTVSVLTAVPAAEPQPAAALAQSAGGRAGGGAPVVTIPPMREPAVGPGAISGVVIDGTTRRPIAGALVQLSGGPAGDPRPRQVTDDAGRFIFTELPAADAYTLSASHPEYLYAGYNSTPGELAAGVALFEAQWFADANIVLYKPASLSGRVIDERGEPVVGVPVRILKSVGIAGQAGYAAGPVAETDDRGMYRVAALTPGQYLVHVPNVQITLADGAVRPPMAPQRPLAMARATGGIGAIIGHFPTPPESASGRAYAMAYHPAARSLNEALPIALSYGESRANADVQLTLVTTVQVSGVLSGTPDAIAGMPVWLLPAGSETAGPGGEAAITMSESSGAFTFLNVPAGRYTLIASRSRSEYSVGGGGRDRLLPERGEIFNIGMVGGAVAGAPGVAYATQGRGGAAAFGRQPVVVDDRDVSNLVVPLAPGVRVSGHFLWDGQQEAPAGVNVPVVTLESADRDLSIGFPQSPFVSPTGQAPRSPLPFTVEGVVPGRYLLGIVLLASGFTVEGAEWRGRDLLSSPLEVTGDADLSDVVIRVTAKTTRVMGTVRDATGAVAESGSVIVFPASPATWDAVGFTARRFKSVPIGASGAYMHTQLPPGDYLIAAISAADRSRWLDRRFLSAAAATATRRRVESGATIAQDLRMTGERR